MGQVVVAMIVGLIVGLGLMNVHRLLGPVAGTGFSVLLAPWLVPALIAGVGTLLLLTLIGAAGFGGGDEDAVAVTTGFGTAATMVGGAAARSALAEVVSAEAGVISVEEAPVETGNRLELTVEEREQIRLAVQAAEQRTKAEIVPMIVARSGLYREVRHWVGLTHALVVLTILLTIESNWLPWGWHASNAAWLLLSALVAYGCGAWMGTLWPTIRLCTSAERMRHKVKLRAEHAFSQHAVSQTRERTGVLIMLSILERQIYILPDRSLGRLARQTDGRWSSKPPSNGYRAMTS
jgi:putative membrane protein